MNEVLFPVNWDLYCLLPELPSDWEIYGDFLTLAAKYGGGIFLLIYIILALTFGYSMIVAETALGRMTRKSPVGAFGKFGMRRCGPPWWDPCRRRRRLREVRCRRRCPR